MTQIRVFPSKQIPTDLNPQKLVSRLVVVDQVSPRRLRCAKKLAQGIEGPLETAMEASEPAQHLWSTFEAGDWPREYRILGLQRNSCKCEEARPSTKGIMIAPRTKGRFDGLCRAC